MSRDYASFFKRMTRNFRCMKQTEHRARAHMRVRVHKIEDDNMSITHSISMTQTDYRVLKANCHVDYSFY